MSERSSALPKCCCHSLWRELCDVGGRVLADAQ
jgi:hypothetical protein